MKSCEEVGTAPGGLEATTVATIASGMVLAEQVEGFAVPRFGRVILSGSGIRIG
jgi:hypothetical protein